MKAQGIKRSDDFWEQHLLEDPYINALKCRYGYVVTVHKAQGGEWQEVFFNNCTKIYGFGAKSYVPFIYTAITRARKKLHLIDNAWIRGTYKGVKNRKRI
jgi:ATP-dependent exoDNAse (exonuclease V) alpha subunit